MAPQALPWRRCLHLTLLLFLMRSPDAATSCRILRCNSDFVAATLDLSSSSGGAGGGGGAAGRGAGGGGAGGGAAGGGGGGGAAGRGAGGAGGGAAGGGGGAAGGGAAGAGGALSREAVNAGYCRALRSYSMCTKRMARACRGDLAYHSAVQGIEDLLLQHRCPRAGPTAGPRPLPQGTLSGDACLYERNLLAREGRAPEYLHCGVFGDPHIRTFSDDFQTCDVRGAWPLVDNEYLYIQATSSPIRGVPHATALTKITVIFKNWRQCIDQQLYQAELDNVPAAFADGSVSSGERRGQHSLTVRTQSPGRHAEIRAAHIGTLLVVRQSGRSLGLSLRSPRRIVEAFGPEHDLQLCVWGCPASQTLNRLRPVPPGGVASAAAARAHCSVLLPARDVYYQACVFDLITSGDLNSSAAAVSALQDATAMISDTRTVHLLPAASAALRQAPSLLLLLLGMLGTLRPV